jgi:peptidoglycan hydrolase-like amidase
MLIKIKLTRQENIDYYHSDLIEIDIEEYLKSVVPSEIGNALLPACKA